MISNYFEIQIWTLKLVNWKQLQTIPTSFPKCPKNSPPDGAFHLGWRGGCGSCGGGGIRCGRSAGVQQGFFVAVLGASQDTWFNKKREVQMGRQFNRYIAQHTQIASGLAFLLTIKLTCGHWYVYLFQNSNMGMILEVAIGLGMASVDQEYKSFMFCKSMGHQNIPIIVLKTPLKRADCNVSTDAPKIGLRNLLTNQHKNQTDWVSYLKYSYKLIGFLFFWYLLVLEVYSAFLPPESEETSLAKIHRHRSRSP